MDSDVQLYSDDSGSGNSWADLSSRSDIQSRHHSGCRVSCLIFPVSTHGKKAFLFPSSLSISVTHCPQASNVLSEKPVAKNVKDAQVLIDWCYANTDSKKVIWSVVENFRYQASFEFTQEQVRRLLGFRAKRYSMLTGREKVRYERKQLHHGRLLRSFKKPNGVKALPIKEVFCWMELYMSRQAQAFYSDLGIPSPAFLYFRLNRRSISRLCDATMSTKSGDTGTFSVLIWRVVRKV